MRINQISMLTIRSLQFVRKAPHAALTRVSFLNLAFLLVALLGCAPSSSSDGGKQNESVASAPENFLELTEETIRERINNAYVRDVPDETGANKPISWRFNEDEPKEFTVVEKQIEGARATIILDIKTHTSPDSRSPRHLAGQIRTKWELQTGWVLRRWEIVETENISMKYQNLPKPPAQNSNR